MGRVGGREGVSPAAAAGGSAFILGHDQAAKGYPVTYPRAFRSSCPPRRDMGSGTESSVPECGGADRTPSLRNTGGEGWRRGLRGKGMGRIHYCAGRGERSQVADGLKLIQILRNSCQQRRRCWHSFRRGNSNMDITFNKTELRHGGSSRSL